MSKLAIQPYIVTERKIQANQQYILQETYELILYHGSIESKSEQFPLKQVHDLTFRKINGSSYFLYLHTDKGMIAFYTDSSPIPFIEQYYLEKNKSV